MSWACLHTHTHYSLLEAFGKPVQVAERIGSLNLAAAAITDKGSVSAAASFIKAMDKLCVCGHHESSHVDKKCTKCDCKEFQKKPIKSILGCEFWVSEPETKPYETMVVLAKNINGWKKIIKAISLANNKDNFYYEPRLSLDDLLSCIDENCIILTGYPGSQLANSLWIQPDAAYKAQSESSARKFINKESLARTEALAEKLLARLGSENLFFEICVMDQNDNPSSLLIANGMRYLAKKLGIKCVAGSNAHYPGPEDYDDHRVLLCSGLQANYNNIHQKLLNHPNPVLSNFFTSQKYYIPTLEELALVNTEDEIKNGLDVASMCEQYSILGPPKIPNFTDGGLSGDKLLEQKCAEGWKSKVANANVDIDIYKKRARHELDVIKESGLSSYFLIVQDYCQAARNMGALLGPGRGSGAGCLISYLLGITSVDPIRYDLLFERFYNAGRNTKDRVSLPDIDTDFPIKMRGMIIEYIRNKYGRERVSQMVTFSRIQGKAALKEVFRVRYPDISFAEVNKICEHIPDESKISDQLQEMKDAGEEPSIIMWSLENNDKELKEYCYLDENGKVQGEYAPAFRQAIRLEGSKKARSKHASGVVICSDPLSDIVPLIYDQSNGELLAGMEMAELEEMGLVKFDILGLAALDKMMLCQNLLANGEVE